MFINGEYSEFHSELWSRIHTYMFAFKQGAWDEDTFTHFRTTLIAYEEAYPEVFDSVHQSWLDWYYDR